MVNGWIKGIVRAICLTLLLPSSSAAQQCGTAEQVVDALYQRILGRAADQTGKEFFVGRLKKDRVSVRRLAQDMAHSPEAKVRFTSGKTPEQVMRAAYAAFLGRPVGAELSQAELPNIQGYAAGGAGAFDSMVAAHFGSSEYAGKYGDDVVPGGAVRYCPSTVEGGDVTCAVSTHPFARGYCAVRQCPNGQWSRGTVNLFASGQVEARAGLETDRVDYGISGWIQFRMKDANGRTVAYGYTQHRSIPAKGPGKARIVDFPPDAISIDRSIAARVRSITVEAMCAGDNFTPFGIEISRKDADKAITFVFGSPSGGGGQND